MATQDSTIPNLTQATSPLASDKYVIDRSGANFYIEGSDFRSVADVRDYGATGDGATDDRAAIQAAIDANNSIFLPQGTYRLASALDDITKTLTITGETKNDVILLRDYVEGTATQGVLHATSGTQLWRNLEIHTAAGNTGGAGMSLIATSSTTPDWSSIENCKITGLGGTGTYEYALYVDGSARTGSPLGVRNLKVLNVDLFASTTDLAAFVSCNNTTLQNTNLFSAGGTATTLRVDGASADESNNFLYLGSNVPDIDLDWTTNCAFYCAASITSVVNTSNVNVAMVAAPFVSTGQTNWVNGKYV